MLQSDCNTETSQNGTVFSSPDSMTTVCSLMIKPMNDNICQIKLQLEDFVLADPDISGVCRTDYMQAIILFFCTDIFKNRNRICPISVYDCQFSS